MTIINKTDLISQVETIASSLNLTTDETNRLALFYKVADNINTSTIDIQAELISRLQTVSTSDALEELLVLIVSTSLITENRVITVPNEATLETLTNVTAGSIYFVEDIEMPYIKKLNGTWSTIDPLLSPTFPSENAYGWGFNGNGELGNNTITSSLSPVSVVGGFTDWISTSVGKGSSGHTISLRANGTLWAWGGNATGQLGNDTVTNRSSPVSVIGDFSDWTAVGAGVSHSLAVRANGTLWAWGNNLNGRLGDNTTVNKSSPVSVVGGFVDWVQASGGTAHSIGVRANGTLWTWGLGSSGQLGNNTVLERSSPVSVIGAFTDWISASAGTYHNLGVRANGTLWAWGLGSSGQLGSNTAVDRSSPVSVVGAFTDWIQASAGNTHSLGVRANGSLWAWGSNITGRLGDNTVVNRSSPVSVVGGFTDWVQVSAGFSTTIALRANGTLWGWGYNGTGPIGDGTQLSKSSPVSVVGGFTDWVQAATGRGATIGIRGS
jgi:alpha-tubulin suppressor-like RCC1 family protein